MAGPLATAVKKGIKTVSQYALETGAEDAAKGVEKKVTKKALMEEAEAKFHAGLKRSESELGLKPGQNVNPFVNPSEAELQALRTEKGGYTGPRRPKDMTESVDGQPTVYADDPDVAAAFPPKSARTRSQYALTRAGSKEGPSSRVADLMANPEVKKRIMEAAKAGVDVADWYDTTPLQAAFTKEFGEEEGMKRFSDYIGMVASTSTDNKIGPNIRTASNYYAQKYGAGRDAAEMPFIRKQDAISQTGAKGPTGVVDAYEVPPNPYGSAKQQTHQYNVNQFASGGIDPVRNPKIAAFYENLMGNWLPATIDKHATRLGAMASRDPRWLSDAGSAAYADMQKAGLPEAASIDELLKTPSHWADIPSKSGAEYDELEKYWTGIAKEMNIDPAQLQAQAWVGGGKQTGLGSPGVTFMDAFKDRIRRTAIRDNIPPDQVLKLMMHGKMSLAMLEGGGDPGAPPGAPPTSDTA